LVLKVDAQELFTNAPILGIENIVLTKATWKILIKTQKIKLGKEIPPSCSL
jgi:hypothetical protein